MVHPRQDRVRQDEGELPFRIAKFQGGKGHLPLPGDLERLAVPTQAEIHPAAHRSAADHPIDQIRQVGCRPQHVQVLQLRVNLA